LASRVLITGASGFTGPYVRSALEARGYLVKGISNGRVAHAEDESVNLLDSEAVEDYVRRSRFEYVVHLAGVSFVAHERTVDQYRVNLLGTINLIEAIARAGRSLRKLVLASSANVYGRPERNPVSELQVPLPVNDYGVSKYAMELMARMWIERFPILIVRPFNYTGVGQNIRFVLPKLVKQFHDRNPYIQLGDTSVVRDFMDVRDVADVYSRLLESDAASDAVNICSGHGHKLSDVLGLLERISGHTAIVQNAASLHRKNEIHELVGSPEKLRAILGDVSFRPLEETLSWMLHSQTNDAATVA
jgi:GDP-6-deoxy-D-talose 4-dehydrogenase